VSPILTRPVREQLEHDRVIRQLQARYKRKHEVVVNPGNEQNQAVMVGQLDVFPDLLLYGQDRGRRLQGTVEVETGESVNQLEALAEWGVFSKLKVPLHLYVPTASLDTVRRLCAEHQIEVGELWTFHVALDQVRFTMIHRAEAAAMPKAKAPAPDRSRPAPKAAPKAAVKAKPRPARAVKKHVKSAAPRKSVANKKKPAARPRAKAASRRRS
jgi:hypothetical protein